MIGILTFWNVPNFGAFCQAYALNKTVKSIVGDKTEVVHIGYIHPVHNRLYRERNRPTLSGLKSLLSLNFYMGNFRFFFGRKIHYPKFDAAWDKIPHIDFYTDDDLEKYHFQNVILGSDSIWEYSTKDFGEDRHLVGLDIHSKKIVAYAPSFGDMTVNDSFPEFVKEGLSGLDKITVRDRTSAEIVSMLLGGAHPDIVLDPTFLWEFTTDSNVIVPKERKYILVYGTNYTEAIVNEVREFAAMEGLQIIGAGLAPQWCDKILTELSPFEWIGLFREAKFVVTCTFHGLMFSIHFRKKVLFYQVEHVKNRSQWLLELTGLSKIYTKKPNIKEMLDYDWNYDEIYLSIQKEKDKSIKLLKEMLAGNERGRVSNA